MALTGEIRKRSGLIVGAVGVALFAFLLSDYSSWFNKGSERVVGEINGETITLQEFSQRKELKELLYQNAGFTIDNQEGLIDEVWEELKFEYFTKEQYEEAGISVNGAELVHLANSENPPQIIRQIFTNNYQSGYDKSLALNYFAAVQNGQLQPQEQFAWQIRENLMIKVREIEKYSKYITNGMYTTSFMAKQNFKDKNMQLDAKVVGLDYTKVDPSTIEVSDSELESYLSKHKEEYKQEANAAIEYVLVDITPSEKDTTAVLEFVTSQIEPFKNAKDDSAFLRGMTETPYVKDNYQPRGTFDPTQEDKIFAADSGDVLGPFYLGGAYELVKVTGFKNDTISRAKASHILIKAEGPTDADTAAAYKKAGEYMREITSGKMTFEEAAAKYGTDGTATRGGDLGWFGPGQMVEPFEKAVFSHKKGDIFLTKTQFGVHIIKVTEGKSNRLARVARLRRPIEFSSNTRDSIYDIVEAIARKAQSNDNFEEVALSEGMQMKVASDIKPKQRSIPGVPDAKELMRWVFDDDTKVGVGSDVMLMDDKLVVAKLTKRVEKGYADLKDVKDQVRTEVIKEKQAAILKEQIATALASAKTPEDLAASIGAPVRTITAQNYAGATLQYFNNDFAVFGTLFGLPENTPSEPIVGDKGVYVAWVLAKRPASEPTPEDINSEKQMLSRRITGAAAGAIDPALKEAAGIVDKRYKFY